jgi:hypothetical protein
MSKHWVPGGGYTEVPKRIEKFLAAVAGVCERHQMSFRLDGSQLVVQPYNEDSLDWIMDAEIDADLAKAIDADE